MTPMLGAGRVETALERHECFFEHGEHKAVARARCDFRGGLIY